MNDYRIITDSSCDLPAALASELELEVIPLSVFIDGHEYKNYLDHREISIKDFYSLLREGIRGKTAAINSEGVVSCLTPFLDKGEDILCLSFSSSLSGTYNATCVAAEELRAKYPGRKIYVVDTLCASLGQGLMVYLAAKLRQSGATIDEVRDYVTDNKLKLCHWFTVDDLMHLKRGGRLNSVSAIAGTILGIKPLLHMDSEGKLTPVAKLRGRRNSIKAIVKRMLETAIEPQKQLMFICHGDCEEDAITLRDMVRAEVGDIEIIINPVGPVIGCHSGPGTLALFFIGTHR